MNPSFVLLIQENRQSNRSKHTDDDDDDEKFNQGEACLEWASAHLAAETIESGSLGQKTGVHTAGHG